MALVVAKTIEDLPLSAENWQPWPGSPTKARQMPGGLLIVNRPGAQFSAVELAFDADFDAVPSILLNVDLRKGSWAAKIRAPDAMKDWVLVRDSHLSGRFVVPLNAPHWTGQRQAKLVLFSISEGGAFLLKRAAVVQP